MLEHMFDSSSDTPRQARDKGAIEGSIWQWVSLLVPICSHVSGRPIVAFVVVVVVSAVSGPKAKR